VPYCSSERACAVVQTALAAATSPARLQVDTNRNTTNINTGNRMVPPPPISSLAPPAPKSPRTAARDSNFSATGNSSSSSGGGSGNKRLPQPPRQQQHNHHQMYEGHFDHDLMATHSSAHSPHEGLAPTVLVPVHMSPGMGTPPTNRSNMNNPNLLMTPPANRAPPYSNNYSTPPIPPSQRTRGSQPPPPLTNSGPAGSNVSNSGGRGGSGGPPPLNPNLLSSINSSQAQHLRHQPQPLPPSHNGIGGPSPRGPSNTGDTGNSSRISVSPVPPFSATKMPGQHIPQAAQEEEGEEPLECVICLMEFSKQNRMASTQCSCGLNMALFHRDCLRQYITKRDTCPNCNDPLIVLEPDILPPGHPNCHYQKGGSNSSNNNYVSSNASVGSTGSSVQSGSGHSGHSGASLAVASAAALAVPEEEPLECVICLMEFDVHNRMASTQCACGLNMALFHRDCLRQWLAKKDTCPNCDQLLVVLEPL
jgi:RNA polymerase subunit RPABC4/transcription elongation factor Spt4